MLTIFWPRPKYAEFHQLQNLGADRGVHLDDLGKRRRVGFRIGRKARELRVRGRHRRDALELADQRGQRGILHELVQRMGLLDDRAQRIAVAGLVQELMGDRQRAHDGFASRLA
jgi:hypothetical protein